MWHNCLRSTDTYSKLHFQDLKQDKNMKREKGTKVHYSIRTEMKHHLDIENIPRMKHMLIEIFQATMEEETDPRGGTAVNPLSMKERVQIILAD